MSKQVYFVVYFDTEDGSFAVDDDRADAVFGGNDVWDEATNEWEGMHEYAEYYEQAREALTRLVATTWKQG